MSPPDDSILIRPGRPEDAAAIVELYAAGTERVLRRESVADYLRDYPSAVAEAGGALVAFAFCCKEGPDVLELANIFVSAPHRSRSIGTRLVEAIEKQASAHYAALIAVNSMLYKTPPDKRPATTFYLRRGFALILDTGPTKMFAKHLRRG